MTERRVAGANFTIADTAAVPKGKKKLKTESQTVLAANPARVEAVICNNGESAVYIALGEPAVANEGIRLNKEGGTYVCTGYSGIITGITASGEIEVCFSDV